MKLTTLIDFLSKNISRLKTIGTILLVVFFFLSLGNNGCQRSKAIELTKQLTGLDLRNTILLKDITKKEGIIILNQEQIDSLNLVIKELKNKAVKLEASENKLQADLRKVKEEMINIPTDSSYKFLQAVYPYPGSLDYPFNEPQVRNIHLDYLENNNLWLMNKNLTNQIDNCKDILAVNSERTVKYSRQLSNVKAQKDNQEEIISNKDKEIGLLKKEKAKEKRGKGFWKIVAGIASGIALVFAL